MTENNSYVSFRSKYDIEIVEEQIVKQIEAGELL